MIGQRRTLTRQTRSIRRLNGPSHQSTIATAAGPSRNNSTCFYATWRCQVAAVGVQNQVLLL